MVQEGFACVCLVKTLELGVDHKLHRALKEQELHAELDRVPAATASAYLPCGGIRAAQGKHSISCAVVGHTTGVIEGHLDNFAELYTMYMGESAEGIETKNNPKVAELLCHMFEKEGVEILKKLKGNFAFCLYDSKLVRVFAVREHGARVHLFQARTAKDHLIISSNKSFLTDCHDVMEFHAGESKYGWHATPRRFPKPGEPAKKHNGSQQISSSGVEPQNGSDARQKRAAGGRRSLDSANPSVDPAHSFSQRASKPPSLAPPLSAFSFNVNAPVFVPGSGAAPPPPPPAPSQSAKGTRRERNGSGRRSLETSANGGGPAASANASNGSGAAHHGEAAPHSNNHQNNNQRRRSQEHTRGTSADRSGVNAGNKGGRGRGGQRSGGSSAAPPATAAEKVWVPKQGMVSESADEQAVRAAEQPLEAAAAAAAAAMAALAVKKVKELDQAVAGSVTGSVAGGATANGSSKEVAVKVEVPGTGAVTSHPVLFSPTASGNMDEADV